MQSVILWQPQSPSIIVIVIIPPSSHHSFIHYYHSRYLWTR